MARTGSKWMVINSGSAIQTNSTTGYDILINGSNHYINFGTTVGSLGYGFRDNGGNIEFKNSGGSWAGIGSGSGGGTLAATSTASDDSTKSIYTMTSGVHVEFRSSLGTSLLKIRDTEEDVLFQRLGFNDSSAYLAASYDVRNWSLTGKNFSVLTQDTVSTGIWFKPDGTRMYMVGTTNSTGDRVWAYDLSIAWDASTAVVNENLSIVGQDTAMGDIWMSPDGTTMYLIGSTADRVFQYTLSTPFSLTGASYTGNSFLISGQELTATGLYFKEDGTKMYIVGSTSDTIYQYTLSTPFDITSAAYASLSLLISGQETAASGLSFNTDGTRCYVVGSTGDDINEYRLSTPWDISTGVFYSTSFTFVQETAPSALYYNQAAQKAYVVGSGSDILIGLDTTQQIKIFGNSLALDGQLYVQDRAEFGSTVYVNGAITTLSTLTVGSTATFNNNVTIVTGATFTYAGIAGNYGSSTATSTIQMAYGATISGATKTVNIGTGGVSGSTTNINIGSSVSGATSTTTLYGLNKFTTDGLGVTQSLTNGIQLINNTAAAAGAQQISPAMRWTGQGWKTDATAASQEVSFIADVLPVQGAASPTGTWQLKSSVNGAAYGIAMTVGSNGTMSTTSQITAGGGFLASAGNAVFAGTGTSTLTSGNIDIMLVSRSFSPTSGTGTFGAFAYTGTINQTGGANGITRGIYINPTLTAAADFRAIDVVTGKSLFQEVLSKYLVEANTAGSGSPNIITASESGTVFTNEGSTALNYHTLPTAVAGLTYTFYVDDADGIHITANTSDIIQINGVASTAAGYAECTAIGGSITLTAINAVDWVATSVIGTWTLA